MNDAQTEQDKEEAAERRKLWLEDRGRRADLDLANVMSLPAGRRVVWRLIDDIAGTSNGSFAGESTHQTAYSEGQRAVGRALMVEARRVARRDYALMLAEAMAELDAPKG